MTMKKRAMSRPVDGIVRLQPKYAGRYSHKFWNAIKECEGERVWKIAYAKGCMLQELEAEVLKYVNDHQPNASLETRAGTTNNGGSGNE